MVVKMKDFLNNFKVPIILGGCALIAIIVTLIVVTGGFSSGYGLYITSAYGSVSVTNSDVSVNASSGDSLKKGDVVTIGEGSSCTIAYQGKNNSEDNYLVLGSNTQIVVSDDFKGKGDGEIFLRNGTVIGNFAAEDNASIIVRTTDATVTLGQAVSKVSYRTNEFTSYTELYTFMGYSKIQLYDEMGNPVNEPEYQEETKWGRVISESDMSSDTAESGGEKLDSPRFDMLNIPFDLYELTAFDIKQLLTIAAFVGEDFPYNTADLKAVYDEMGGDPDSTVNTEPEIPEETSVTTEDNSDSIQTAEPIETSAPPTATTLPWQTTAPAPVYTQAPVTTTAPPDTETPVTTTDSLQSGEVHMVIIVIDGGETIQEVPHGGNAVRPEDPVIDGLIFIGWDGSFENITEDTVITAMFSDSLGGDVTDSATETTTSDTETSVSDLPVIHTVTFDIDGAYYYVPVADGDRAAPPFTPESDSFGNPFIGWSRSLDNITEDVTITALYGWN